MSERLRTLTSGLGFAESPRWYAGELWFVDYFAGNLQTITLEGKRRVVANIPGTPGGLGFLPDGTPLVVSQREFALYAIDKQGQLTRYADLRRFARGAANDLLVDGSGRAYVGHHGFDFFGGAPPQPSSLLLVDTDGTVQEVADGLVFPNGMALAADGRTLILAESFAGRLTAFDIGTDGRPGARRVWAELSGHTPDGICLDAEGAVWAGSPLSGAFLRVQEGGSVLDRLDVADGRWAVACVLGGSDRRTLCCVTAATTLEAMPQGKSEAFIELADVSAPGAGVP